tara:strand:+ start:3174 stop:4208 length:1035 start_codon:yes stop_codon:yes gene_type:complete
MKFTAAVLVEQNRPLEFMELAVPKLSYGQVLVKLTASRICGSQLGEIVGVKGPDRWLPHLLGHEGAGVVVETGPEVSTVKLDDKVCLHWRPGQGIESRAPKYQSGNQIVNAGFITTFNEYAVISENRLTAVPDSLDDEITCLLADTLTTGFGVIVNDAAVKIGESLVIFGVGGIGLGAVLGAKLAGAYPIVAVDLFDHKLKKAAQYGATHTLLANQVSLNEAILEIVGQSGADVVIDGTGVPAVIESCYDLTKAKQGRTVLFGVMHHEKRVSLHTLPLHFGKVLTGSEGGGSVPHQDLPKYIRMIENGRLDTSGFVSHRGSLLEVNAMIAKMRAGEVIHSIIHF